MRLTASNTSCADPQRTKSIPRARTERSPPSQSTKRGRGNVAAAVVFPNPMHRREGRRSGPEVSARVFWTRSMTRRLGRDALRTESRKAPNLRAPKPARKRCRMARPFQPSLQLIRAAAAATASGIGRSLQFPSARRSRPSLTAARLRTRRNPALPHRKGKPTTGRRVRRGSRRTLRGLFPSAP